MISIVFAIICIISLIFAVITGNITALSVAVVEGAEKAVMLTISLCGMMSLWNGIMNVLEKAGACKVISKIIRPFIKLFFPKASRDHEVTDALSASVAANMLGLGNAATPLGIRVMRAMQKIGADNEMVSFAVMNTAPISLMPGALIALRSAGGAENPFDIVVAVWICSTVSMIVSLIFSKLFSMFSAGKKS